MSSSATRTLMGALTVAVLAGIVFFSLSMFAGGFGTTVPVTVVTERVGLVMNPKAKVQMHGVQVGQVESIETRRDGKAVLHLAMDPQELKDIPGNVNVDITSSTVFGAKHVDFVAPSDPSSKPLLAGQQLDADHVTVEINTVFQQLTSVLKAIDPIKLNQTLAAFSGAVNGRGEKLGQTVVDLDHLLEKLDPSLENISRDLELAPVGLNAYADVAPDLVDILDHTTKLGDTLVDQQENLDKFLVSAAGLADVGNDVVGQNRQGLADDLRMLVPTTDLTNQYHDGLRCGLQGIFPLFKTTPLDEPGVKTTASFTFGVERYRYPQDLPKVAAKGGPHCQDMMLPTVPVGKFPPFLVADVGANPWKYGNQGLLRNSDGIKEALFGPLQGPPRNSAQIGMPG